MTEFNDIESDKNRASRLKRFLRLGLLMAIVALSLGNTDCPRDPHRPPTITCRDFSIRLDPGTCKVFPNPCSDNGEWARRPAFDGIRLEPTEEQQGQYDPFDLHLLTTRVGDQTTRSLCIAANAQPFVNQPIDLLRLGTGVRNCHNVYQYSSIARCARDRHTFNNRGRPEFSTSRDC